MGRFYKTAIPTFVDNKMFELPWQLMANTLMNKEKAVDEEIGTANTFLDKLTAQGLSPDQPRIKEVIGGYENRINDVVNNIKQNPMEYNKYSDVIRTLGRDINKDWSMGEISKIEDNRKAYTDYSTQLDEAYKKNPKELSPVQIDRLKQQALARYKEGEGAKYNAQSGGYNQFSGENALQLGNVAEILSENVGKNLKASGLEVQQDKNTGQWLKKTTKGTWEGVKEDVVREAAKKFLDASPEIRTALEQRKNLGIEGFEDTEVYLNNAIESTVATHSYMKNKDTTDIRSNEKWMQDYKWAYDEKKEKEAEDYAIINLSENKDTYTSGTVSQLNLNNYRYKVGLNKTITDAQNVLYELLGDTPLYKANEKLIEEGNFVGMLKAGVPKETVNKLQNDYRSYNNKLLAIKGLKNTYIKEMGGEAPMKDGKPDTVKFQNWLTKNKDKFGDVNVINQKSSWAYSGLNGKQQAVITKAAMEALQTFKLDLGEDRTFETVDGRKVFFDPKNPKYKDGVTIQDLIDNKVLYEGQTKQEAKSWNTYGKDVLSGDDDYIPFNEKITHKKGERNEVLGPTSTYVYYKDGKPVNVKIGANSMGLVNGLSNNGTSDIAFTLDIGKKKLVARNSTDKFSSVGINKAIEATASERDFRNTVDRMSKTIYEDVNGSGYKWDNVNGTITAPNGKIYQQDGEEGVHLLRYILGY